MGWSTRSELGGVQAKNLTVTQNEKISVHVRGHPAAGRPDRQAHQDLLPGLQDQASERPSGSGRTNAVMALRWPCDARPCVHYSRAGVNTSSITFTVTSGIAVSSR
jgi:hypothetical protein